MRPKRNIAKDLFYSTMSNYYKECYGYSPPVEKQEDWDRIIDSIVDAAKEEIIQELKLKEEE